MQLKKLFLILPFFLFTINAYAGVTFYDFWINKSSPHEYVKGDRFDAQFKIKNNTNTTLSIKKVEVTFNKNGNYYKNCWYRSINKTLYKNNTYHATIGECTVNDVGNFTVVAKVQYTDNSYQDSYTYNISVVNPPIPPRPSLNSPSGNITDKTPTTKWTTVSGVTRYEFYLYDDTENEYIYGSRYNGGKSVSSTSFTSQTLKIGHTYNWWVTSCNSSGCSSQGSTYKTFKVINASQNGQCGTANGKNYSSSTTSYGSNTQCSVGNSNDTRFPTQGNTIYWTCDGLNGGNSVNCEASRQSVSLPNVSSKGINPNPVKSGESMKVYCNFYDNLPSGYKVKVGVDSSTTIYPLLGSKTTYKNFIAPSSTGTHTIYYKLYNGTSYVKNLGDSTFTVKPSSLNPPSGVSASDNTYEDKVKVTWNSVSGSSKYKIYRSQYATSNYENIDETSNTYYNDTTAVAGYTYFYTIKAYSSSLGLSSYSNYDSGKRKNVVLSPTITSVTPLIATQNVPKNYTIIGTNLTSSITGNIQGSSTHCTYVSGTSTNVVLSCKAEVLGDKRFYLKDKSGGTTISGSENIYITVNAPQSTLPSSVDTPVNGTGWSYRQHTQDNATYYDGIGSANDNNTWDLNYGSGYDDDGLPVYAVEDGVRQTFDGWGGNSFGQFLIKHTNSNGSWYSGYLHMKNITTATTIKKGDKIGEISRTGYLVNPAITSPHLHFGVYELVNNQLLSRNITISKNKNWEQPKVNKVPQHISTTLAPTNINNAQSFTITSKWKDSDGDFIVNVKARYRAKNNGSFTEVVLAHSRNTRDEVEFSRTIANGLVSGDYELEVQASDKSLLNGDVLHSTGWIKVDDFKIYSIDSDPTVTMVNNLTTCKTDEHANKGYACIKTGSSQSLTFIAKDDDGDLKNLEVNVNGISLSEFSKDLYGSSDTVSENYTFSKDMFTAHCDKCTECETHKNECLREFFTLSATAYDNRSIKYDKPSVQAKFLLYDLSVHNEQEDIIKQKKEEEIVKIEEEKKDEIAKCKDIKDGNTVNTDLREKDPIDSQETVNRLAKVTKATIRNSELIEVGHIYVNYDNNNKSGTYFDLSTGQSNIINYPATVYGDVVVNSNGGTLSINGGEAQNFLHKEKLKLKVLNQIYSQSGGILKSCDQSHTKETWPNPVFWIPKVRAFLNNDPDLKDKSPAVLDAIARGTAKALADIAQDYYDTLKAVGNNDTIISSAINIFKTIDYKTIEIEYDKTKAKIVQIKDDVIDYLPQLKEAMINAKWSEEDIAYYSAYTSVQVVHEFVPVGKLKYLVKGIKRPTWLSKGVLIVKFNSVGTPIPKKALDNLSQKQLEALDNALLGKKPLGKNNFKNDKDNPLSDEDYALIRDVSNSKFDWWRNFRRGNDFNIEQKKHYKYNEIYICKQGINVDGSCKGSGKDRYVRLDSYDKENKKIVSRKHTKFDESEKSIKQGKNYMKELRAKYYSGATIAPVKSSKGMGFNTKEKLQGKMILEIPKQPNGIPKDLLDYAKNIKPTIEFKQVVTDVKF